MSRQLSKLEQNIVKVGAILLSLPVIVSMVDESTTAKVAELDKAPVAIATPKPQPAPRPEYCNQDRYHLTIQTFDLCISEGMSYYEVGTLIGAPGKLSAQSGAMKVYGWDGEWAYGYVISGGYMSVSFHNDVVVSKAQHGLPVDPNFQEGY